LDLSELAQATVQIIALMDDGSRWRPIWSGSGSIIEPQGLILTNAHIVDDQYGDYDALGVAITARSDQLPQLIYLAEVVTTDPVLDVAVIRITSDLEGVPVDLDLPYVNIADSDEVEIGDRLRILGYPGIGGETITFTEGAVSGFTLERGVSGRAWIKTDATIAGGNSGGMGTNTMGELIGIPSIVTSGSEHGQTVDCRPLADTDQDGDIDQQDTCVPVGGFINALRPVNLAQPLIEAAKRGEQYRGGAQPETGIAEEFDISKVVFSNLVFSDGVTEDDKPMQLWYALPGDPTHICAFWDFEHMANGLIWSSYWFVNGELSQENSVHDQSWGGGKQGNWWVCIFNEAGFHDSLYEIVLEVVGQALISDAVFVGGNRDLAEYALSNQSSATLCDVLLSPTGALNWGQDELDPEEVILPGETRVINLATGTYDMRLLNCDGVALLEDYSLEIDASFTYTAKD